MTPIADMVAQMIDAGVPRDAIVLAVRTAEECLRVPQNSADVSADVSAERRRATDRERKRLARLSAENPQKSADSAEFPVSTISILESNNSKKERNSRGSGIPSDWKPIEKHYLEGAQRGHDRSKIDEFGEDMRLWAEANANRPVARKLDWDKTFSGWIRRQLLGASPILPNLPAKNVRQFPSNIPREKMEKFARWWTPDIPENIPPEQWQGYRNGKCSDEAPRLV